MLQVTSKLELILKHKSKYSLLVLNSKQKRYVIIQMKHVLVGVPFRYELSLFVLELYINIGVSQSIKKSKD